jgi:hypothetical protein
MAVEGRDDGAERADADVDDDDVEVFANGVAFARAASWLGASSALTHETFAAEEVDAGASRERGSRAPRLGLGATKSRAKTSWEDTKAQGATRTALDKALARRKREAAERAEREAAARGGDDDDDSESEDDRARMSGKAKKQSHAGVYGAGRFGVGGKQFSVGAKRAKK